MGLDTPQTFKAKFKSGEYKPERGEVLKDGLPYCSKCGGKRYCILGDGEAAVRCICKCEQQEREKTKEDEQRLKKQTQFFDRQKLAMLGERYASARFSTAVITENNSDVYGKCINYAKHSVEVFDENIGLYIYGDNSSGKTYLTACLCNELVEQGWRCVYTNLATILNEIKSSYDGAGMSESVLLTKLKGYQFAFIDDIGKEFMGREYNASTAKWAEEKLFEVLNARYNAQKPTVFTSNYSIGELAGTLKMDKAIVERINEMSTRVYKLEGDDFRSAALQQKGDRAKKLGL